MNLEEHIRAIPDFPKPGIVFRDITPLLLHYEAFGAAVDRMTAPFRESGITKVAAAEARGFLFGVPIAERLACGFVPVRKPGKLPAAVREASYELEYGHDTLQMHDDAIRPGDRVLLVDDLLATGGTLAACVEMIAEAGGELVGCSCLIELPALQGRAKLGSVPVEVVLSYD